jgi:hypothetical protein
MKDQILSVSLHELTRSSFVPPGSAISNFKFLSFAAKVGNPEQRLMCQGGWAKSGHRQPESCTALRSNIFETRESPADQIA